VEKGIPEIRGELIKPNGTLDTDTTKYRNISHDTAKQFPRTELHEGDFVLSVRGTMGKVAIIPNFLNGANMTANLIRISPNRKKLYPSFLKQVFISDKFQQMLNNASSSTTIKTITAPELKHFRIALPQMHEQKKIADILCSIDEESTKAVENRAKLNTIKKGLMQVLLTGRVRVNV
jgi:type I restriction enzyme S subunit